MPSKYIRTGFLPFYKSGISRDWQKLGYWNNWLLSLKYLPLDKLVSFRTPVFVGVNSAPSTMKIRRVQIINNDVTVISESEVTSNLQVYTEVVNNETLTYYYRQQTNLETPLTSGYIYDIYIEDSKNNIFISDIFVAITETDLYLYTEGGEAYLTEDGQQIIVE